MRHFYQFAIVVASTAAGAAFALCMARSPLSGWVAKLLAGTNAEGDNILGFLVYAGMVCGILMTLGVIGGLVAGVALARRVGKPSRPLELEAA